MGIVNKQGKLIIIFLLFFGTAISAQHLSNQVIVPLGEVVSNGSIYLSHTIGETAVELFSTYGFDLTQGFQQPLVKFMVGTKPLGTGVKVYPNPVVDNINVEFFGSQKGTFSIIVININGTVVFSDRVSFIDDYWQIVNIPVSGFSMGMYFVRITNETGNINRTFKIDKM